jgi:putative transposase
LIKKEELSVRRACIAVGLSFATYYYKAKPKIQDDVIISELEKLAEKYPTYGFKKMFHLNAQMVIHGTTNAYIVFM